MLHDTALFDLIEAEGRRQKDGIELIASENYVSDDVMRAMGSCLTILAGIFVERFSDRRSLIVIGMALATAIAYAFGTAWLAFQMEIPFTAALSVGVIPYLPGDTLKIILAVIIGPALKIRLQKLR